MSLGRPRIVTHFPEGIERSVVKEIDAMCSCCEGMDRKTARLFLLGHHYEENYVFNTEQAIRDWNDVLKRDSFLKLYEKSFGNSSVRFEFAQKRTPAIMCPETTIIQDLIAQCRVDLVFPSRFVVIDSFGQETDLNKSLSQIAEENRIFETFHFDICELCPYELIGEVEDVPESFVKESPHFADSEIFDGLEFTVRLKGRIRVTNPDSPCFGDEFILYYFHVTAGRFWLFFDSCTPVRHPLVSNDERLFLSKNRIDGGHFQFGHMLRQNNVSNQVLYEKAIEEDLSELFSTSIQPPIILLNMFHFRSQNLLIAYDQRYDQILFQKLKSLINKENSRIAKIERLTTVKLKFEPASLEYFMLLKRNLNGHATTDNQTCLNPELFDVFTHEKNILQSIVLYSNDWLSILSAKLVSRTWYDFLSNDKQFVHMYLSEMVDAYEEMLDYVQMKVQRVYKEYESLEIDFPLHIYPSFGSKILKSVTVKLHWRVDYFLKLYGFIGYQINLSTGKSVGYEQLLSSFFVPDKSNEIFLNEFGKRLTFLA